MKLLSLIITFNLTVSLASAQNDFPADHWILLTDLNGRKVIFHPCDAANGEVKISEDENGIAIEVLYGQEAEMLEVVDFIRDGDVFTFDCRSMEEVLTVQFQWQENGLGSWDFGTGALPGLYVTESNSVDYAEVTQPCTDCWNEEDCQEEN